MRSLLLAVVVLGCISCYPLLPQATAADMSPAEPAMYAASPPVLSSAPPTRYAGRSWCERNPLACVIDVIIEGILAPVFGAILSDAFSEARSAVTLRDTPSASVRLGRTVLYESAYGPLVFPYVAVGAYGQAGGPGLRGRASVTPFLKTALGARTDVSTWHPVPPGWTERVQVSAEVQWLSNRSVPDQLWVELAPGVTLSEGRPASRVHLTAAVAVAGDLRSTVCPGLGLEFLW